MSKQTAVEWLADELYSHLEEHGYISTKAFSMAKMKAKAMEKEQMKKAAIHNTTKASVFRKIFEEQFEKYYDKTYKGGNNG